MSSGQDQSSRAALAVAAAATAAVTAAIGLFVFALLSVGAFFTASNNSTQQLNDCGAGSTFGDVVTVPRATGSIAQQQEANARDIEKGVRAAGGSGRAVYVALVAAVGESDLINVGYGDRAGPDSRGLFQQRKGWGTLEQRMNPVWAAGAFMLGPHQGGKGGLLQLTGWEQLPVTTAIHRVQINADPNHYSRFEARARAIGQKAGVNFEAPAGTTEPGSAGCAGAADPNDTSLTLDNPSGTTTMDGHAVSRIVAAQILLAERESGIDFRVMQGGFGGSGYAASGTSHNYSGVVDVSPGTVEAEKVLRRAGFAAWSRNVPGRSYVGSGIHVHAVSLIDPGNKNHPQVTGSWARGENGLNGGTDPAPHYDWYPALRRPR
ncbi:hypothetical protein GCM10009616_34440 [Microlunatus lacustris]